MNREIAVGLINTPEGLLTLYRNDQGHFELPGGKIRDNERPEDTVVRELKEELGVVVTTLGRVAMPLGITKRNGDRATVHLVPARIEQGIPHSREALHGEVRRMGPFGLRYHRDDMSPALSQVAKLIIDGDLQLEEAS